MATTTRILNEVPEHMAQEFPYGVGFFLRQVSSMKFLSTWLRNQRVHDPPLVDRRSSMKFLSTWLRNFVGLS